MLDAIYSAIGSFLGWLDKLTGSYIVALFIFAIVVEILLLPLGIKQQKNTIRQAKLRPKEMAIRKKYAGRNDQATQQKVTQEIQDLYQRENFNPASGCLPLLLQIPIIWVLYEVVNNPVQHLLGLSKDMVQTLQLYMTSTVEQGGLAQTLGNSTRSTIELLSKIKDLGAEKFVELNNFVAPEGTTLTATGAETYTALMEAFENGLPNLNFLGLNLGLNPSFTSPSWLLLIPVLTFVVYFASMKITRRFTYQPTTGTDQQAACSNTLMDVSMPLMSVFFSFAVPGAIGVYWIFKSIATTIKQIIMHFVMPIPKFTEEDYKAAEKEMAGKQSKRATEATNLTLKGGMAPVRSLHHIDDEDFEDTREQAELRKKLIEEAEQKAQRTKEKSKNVPGMKEDNRHEDKAKQADENEKND